jgi:uncharacterized protein (DUF934 family)
VTLLKDGAIVADPWTHLADEALPSEGDVIVPLSRLTAGPLPERRPGRLGVVLRNTDPVSAVVPYLGLIDVIALEFPKFTDGRAYSQARVLREQCGYTGELRAVGQVLIDQLLLMRRCGFDAFEIGGAQNLPAWRKAFEAFSVVYQPTGDGRTPVSRLRRRLAAAAQPVTGPTPRSVVSPPSCTAAVETQRGTTVSSPPRHTPSQSDATSCALPSAASPRSTPCEPSLSLPSI